MITLILAITLYVVLTGITVYMMYDSGNFDSHNSMWQNIRKIIGIITVGAIVALLYAILILTGLIVVLINN